MQYKSLLCSCIICKELKSAKGIHSHYISSHLGDAGKNQMQGKKDYSQIATSLKLSNFKKAKAKWRTYYQSPKKCLLCENTLDWFKRNNNYCSMSCRATDTNVKRGPRSEQARTNIRNGMKSFLDGLSDTDYQSYIQKTHSYSQKQTSKHPNVRQLKLPKPTIEGPYTRIYRCVCKFTGRVFYSTTVKQIYPGLRESKSQYWYSARFTFGISSYPLWFTDASELITKYGWYSTPGSRKGITNLNGISRDHMYSVTDGWINNIPPEIISHPANCQLVPHKQNQSKHAKSKITIEELYDRIAKFEKLYGGSVGN